jgi:hypothetical protein
MSSSNPSGAEPPRPDADNPSLAGAVIIALVSFWALWFLNGIVVVIVAAIFGLEGASGSLVAILLGVAAVGEILILQMWHQDQRITARRAMRQTPMPTVPDAALKPDAEGDLVKASGSRSRRRSATASGADRRASS